jgi:hypothetical protein
MGSTSSPNSLASLPKEIVIQIINHLPAQRDIHAICLVNHHLNSIADPVLYKSIRWNQPKHHFAFTESLAKRPRRGSLIMDVRLEYPGSELEGFVHDVNEKGATGRVGIDGFSYTISMMSNLETLEIEVPEGLCRGIGTLFNGPFDLACLRTCKYFSFSFILMFIFWGVREMKVRLT